MQQNADILVQERTLVREAIEMGWDYSAYRELVGKQVAEGRTSGFNQSEAYVYYTLLNHKRMNRWDKKIVLPEALKATLAEMERTRIWLVLTETWCGDAAPVLPVMHAFVSAAPSLTLRIAHRDEHPLLMDRFLTEGARSIPKLLVVEPDTYQVVGSWGPRPKGARKLVESYKEKHGKLTPEFRESLQKWYNKDRGVQIIQELSSLLALE